ncbi:MAG: hypothetical protein R3B60_03115 [Candidatus Paceibacterota bacterium]
MNNLETNENSQHKSSFAKFLIIIIILLLLAGSAWGAVKIVKNFPETFSHLASIADTVYNYDPTEEVSLVVKTDREVINNGEILSVWWNNSNTSGNYSFSYSCQDGVAIDLKVPNSDFVSINCDNSYNLDQANHIELKVDSEKWRFTDVNFSISHIRNNTNLAVSSDKITVVNSQLSTINNDYENNTEPTTDNDDVSISNTEPAISDSSEENTNTNEEVATEEITNNHKPAPVQQPIYTYAIPVSDPNGTIDLVLSNVATGYINEIGIFIETNEIKQDSANAVKFTVHNIGTKTSEDWFFTADVLGNTVFNSRDQKSLKPNERSTIIIQLPAIKEQKNSNTAIHITTDNDRNINNNYLSIFTTFTK